VELTGDLLRAGALALANASVLPAHFPSTPSPPAASFEELARRAAEARESGRLDAAIDLYEEALARRPDWVEGWWYLGTMAYERDRSAQCRDSFARLVELEPDAAPAWALLGLCEFQLEEYAASRRHLEKALASGPLDDEAMGRVAVFHQALLLIHDAQFELATAPLTRLLQTQAETPELVEACGLVLLRLSLVPSEIAPADRELVEGAGRAYCAHLARKGDLARSRFEEALSRHPRERHLHYGYGLSLAQQGRPEAIEEFRKEIDLHPDHVLAQLELAFNLLARGRTGEAREAAETAVRLDPDLFAPHLALGRALVSEGELALGIYELETAVRLAPGIAETYLALARAYAQAGRPQDATRANAVFKELEATRRRQAPEPSGVDAQRP
jgi:tetratricopeptide (TPR) repeat protein